MSYTSLCTVLNFMGVTSSCPPTPRPLVPHTLPAYPPSINHGGRHKGWSERERPGVGVHRYAVMSLSLTYSMRSKGTHARQPSIPPVDGTIAAPQEYTCQRPMQKRCRWKQARHVTFQRTRGRCRCCMLCAKQGTRTRSSNVDDSSSSVHGAGCKECTVHVRRVCSCFDLPLSAGMCNVCKEWGRLENVKGGRGTTHDKPRGAWSSRSRECRCANPEKMYEQQGTERTSKCIRGHCMWANDDSQTRRAGQCVCRHAKRHFRTCPLLTKRTAGWVQTRHPPATISHRQNSLQKGEVRHASLLVPPFFASSRYCLPPSASPLDIAGVSQSIRHNIHRGSCAQRRGRPQKLPVPRGNEQYLNTISVDSR